MHSKSTAGAQHLKAHRLRLEAVHGVQRMTGSGLEETLVNSICSQQLDHQCHTLQRSARCIWQLGKWYSTAAGAFFAAAAMQHAFRDTTCTSMADNCLICGSGAHLI